jgi:hypothetical protein
MILQSRSETDLFGALMQSSYLDLLLGFQATARTFLRDGRYPHRSPIIDPRDLFRQPVLAATWSVLAAVHGSRPARPGGA